MNDDGFCVRKSTDTQVLNAALLRPWRGALLRACAEGLRRAWGAGGPRCGAFAWPEAGATGASLCTARWKWQTTTGDALLAATTGASTANRSPTATTYLATAAIAG